MKKWVVEDWGVNWLRSKAKRPIADLVWKKATNSHFHTNALGECVRE